MSRILATTAVFAVLAAPAAAQNQGGAQPVSWAQPQIKVVVSHGLMASSIQTFHPNDPLTRGAGDTGAAGGARGWGAGAGAGRAAAAAGAG